MNLLSTVDYIFVITSINFMVEGQIGFLSPVFTPRIATTSGSVMGITTASSYAFYQIPYAQPPIGDLRWKDPIAVKNPADTNVNAFFNRPVRCFQVVNSIDDVLSENCLVLNIFVPRNVSLPVGSSSKLLPVMFFIHGGGFKYGSGTEKTFQANEFAQVTNTVIVTINYRLGPLGFLTLQEEGEENIVGNQGFKDQRLALEWVQKNIGMFGGDKNQVTIFGNSAGALSAMLHLVSPKSKDLFRAVIQQSNPAIYSFYHMTPEVALRVSRRLIEALGCNGTNTTERQCLMETKPERIIAAVPGIETSTAAAEGSHIYVDETFFPIIDGEDITDLPMNLMKSGQWHKEKDMIIGVNTEESLDFQFYFPEGMNVDQNQLENYFETNFGSEFAEKITKKYMEDYPPPPGQEYRSTFAHALSHFTYDCPSKLIARYAANTGHGDVYFYTNSHAVLFKYCVDQGGNASECKFAYHASELPYVFRTLSDSQKRSEANRAIQNQFSTYWGSFARTQSPSNDLETPVGDFTPWPKYQNFTVDGVTSWSYLEITSPNSTVKNGYNDAICDFWASINYARPIDTTTVSTPTEMTTTTTPTEMTTSSGRRTSYFYFMVAITAVIQFVVLL